MINKLNESFILETVTIQIPENIDNSNLSRLKKSLETVFRTQSAIKLNVRNLNDIDLSVLQLISVFIIELKKQKRDIIWEDNADQFNEYLEILGFKMLIDEH